MAVRLESAELERFRSWIAGYFGWCFEEQRLDFLAEILRQRMERRACERFADYDRRYLSANTDGEEAKLLSEQLTVCETFFFRYAEQLAALTSTAIPKLELAGNRRRALRILCAGCASGEEAYTIAILMREHFPDAARDIRIHAVDINGAMLKRAERGVYGKWSLRATSGDIAAKYFHAKGGEWLLDESIKSMVTFERRNLADDDAGFWHDDAFDIVFCRNVTMYFTPAVTRALVARIARSLAPGGFLFLGHAETLRNVSNAFRLHHVGDAFCYERVADSREPATSRVDDSWFDIIGRSAQRVIRLTDKPDLASLSAPAAAHVPPFDLAPVLVLLQGEKFAEALELLSISRPAVRADANASLVLAVLLTHTGDVHEAEQTCRRMLDLDATNAEAYYVTALCREQAGDDRAAAELYRKAAQLHAAFAMPHLRLALIAKRARDVRLAEHEFTLAAKLLSDEHALRIILFGGGFTREALIEFCRMEVLTCTR